MKISNYVSPVYNLERISVFDIISQEINPNSMTNKAFAALQISIFNSGYVMPITVAINNSYKGSGTDDSLTKIKAAIGERKGFLYDTNITDKDIRSWFKYKIVDGTQRSSVVRVGTKLFLEDENKETKSENWSKGENVPTDAGSEMLKYLAWRENFSLPCTVIEGDDIEFMSSTILLNSSRGAHDISKVKSIVWDLVNIANMSKGWIAKNLFLDPKDVDRLIQLNGIRSAYSNDQDFDFSWIMEEDEDYISKEKSYIRREAFNFLKENHPDIAKIIKRDSVLQEAEKLGFKSNGMKQSKVKINPNGTRSESRIFNDYIPD